MANFRNGQVKIANEILDQLAVLASEEIYGVKERSQAENKLNLSQDLGPKSAITFNNGNVCVDLSINLYKNVNVRKTVKAVQENVVRIIETMTGLSVSRVNVTVPKLEI